MRTIDQLSPIKTEGVPNQHQISMHLNINHSCEQCEYKLTKENVLTKYYQYILEGIIHVRNVIRSLQTRGSLLEIINQYIEV